MKTELLKSIAYEQAQFAKLYADSLPKRKPQKGIFGILKGDTVTYQDPKGTVTTKKIKDVLK